MLSVHSHKAALSTELETLRDEAVAEIEKASGGDALRDVEVRYLGRKSRLTEILRGIRDLPVEERRVVGPAGNQLRHELEALIARRRDELERLAEEELLVGDRLDLTLPGRRPPRGAPHPLREAIRRIEDAFIGIGYQIAEGPEGLGSRIAESPVVLLRWIVGLL